MAAQRTVFAVPVTSTNLAPEVLYGNADNIPLTTPAGSVQMVVEVGVATATVEVQVLRPGGVPATDGDWVPFKSFTAAVAGTSDVFAVAKLPVRLKARSGGTSGNVTASLVWLP